MLRNPVLRNPMLRKTAPRFGIALLLLAVASWALAGEGPGNRAAQAEKDALVAAGHGGGKSQIGRYPEPTDAGKAPAELAKFSPITVRYDTGTVTGFSVSPASRTFGNRFNTCAGLPLSLNSVTQVTFWLTGNAGAVFYTFYDQLNTATGMANVIEDYLASTTETTVTSPGWNTHLIANVASGTEPSPLTFPGTTVIAGVWNTNQNTATPAAEDSVGLDSSGTFLGQGYHGVGINFTGGGFSTIPNTNVLFRITGKKYPVELMSFSVEEE